MRFLMKISVPNEPFNAYVKDGSAGKKMQEILGEIKPEAAYFTAIGGKRTAFLIVNFDHTSQIPALGEPWFLTFNASIEFDPVMLGDDLAKAGLEALGKKWG